MVIQFIKVLMFSIVLLNLISCGNKSEGQPSRKVLFKTGYNYQPKFSGVYIDDNLNKELIYFAEPVSKKKIMIFDLQGNLEDTISLEPVDYLCDYIEGIEIYSKSSIYLFLSNQIIIIDNNAKIIRTIKLTTENISDDIFLFHPSSLKEFSINKNSVILNCDWRYNKDNLQQDFDDYYQSYFKKPMFVKINGLTTETIKYKYSSGATTYNTLFNTPKAFLESIKYKEINGSLFTFSSYSNQLLRFDNENFNFLDSFIIDSQSTSIGINPLEINDENKIDFGQKASALLSKSGAIASIYYNDKQKNYFITVFHEIIKDKEIDYKFAPFSILKFDSNFKKISETEFTDGQYSCSSLILTTYGFYILNKNESTEEEFSYHVFNF